MDDEWKTIIARAIYGGFTLFAIIGAFLTQTLVISGTMAFILIIITAYADDLIRKILKKATGITDEELDDVKDDIKPLSAEPEPEVNPDVPTEPIT